MEGRGSRKNCASLVEGDNRCAVVIYDEIDKVNIARVGDRPLDPCTGCWRPATPPLGGTNILDVAFDARGVIHICTANAVDGIAPSLLDRMLVLTVPTPTPTQRALIAQQIYARLSPISVTYCPTR